jgi:hypothetical protein
MMKNISVKKIAIFIALLLIIVATIIALMLATTDNSTKKASTKTTYNDPWSGETVVEEPSNLPTERPVGDNIVMLGFIKLIDIGVAYDQVSMIKTEFNDFRKTQKESINEISIDVSTVKTSLNSDTGVRTITFTVVTNRKTKLEAVVTYSGLGDPALKLYDSSGKKVY